MEFTFTELNPDNYPPNINQNIIIHNIRSNISELFEFHSPYVITIENCSVSTGNFQFLQINPGDLINTVIKCIPYTNSRPLHQHNYLEVMFVLSGSVIHHIENQFVTYQPGQCCIMNRNMKHCEEFSSDFKAVFITFRDDFINDIIENDIYFTPDETQQKFNSNIYKMLKENNDPDSSFNKVYLDFTPIVSVECIMAQLNSIIDNMVYESIQKRHGYYFIMKGLFARFFSLLEDPSLYCFARIQTDSSMQEYLFNKIAHIMEANNGRVPRLKLEELLNYNGEYLNRIVKKYTGMNLVLYGQSFYLNKAKQLLLDTNKNIMEIVEELGFANRNHFNQIFKKKYGVTPSEFRKINTGVNNKNIKPVYTMTANNLSSTSIHCLEDLFEVFK